jgi:hypothetical protein
LCKWSSNDADGSFLQSDPKTGKTVLSSQCPIDRTEVESYQALTHPRVCCRLHHWRTSTGRSAYERQQFCGGTTYSWTIKVADDGFISAANVCKRWLYGS